MGRTTESSTALNELSKDARGNRTHFCRVAAGRLAVWLERQCPRQESNLAYDLRRVACLRHTPRTPFDDQ